MRESERTYEKEKEEARVREQQARATGSSQRPEYNFLSLNSSIPIKNTSTTAGKQNRQTERGIHFNPNTIQHLYSMTGTTSHNGWYEPAANDSIIQGAGTAPGGQVTTNTTNATGHNKAWRNNNRENAPTHTTFPPRMTRPTGCNGFFNDSLNSSNNRNAPMCFRCTKQGHMRHECMTDRVFCNYCKSNSNSNRACRKLTTPSPTNSHIPTGYYPTATSPPLTGNVPNQGKHTAAQPQPTSTTNNGLWF